MQVRKTNRSPITKAQFHEINKHLKWMKNSGQKPNIVDVAKYFEVSTETVRCILKAGTWPKFVEYKRARRERANGRPMAGVRPEAARPANDEVEDLTLRVNELASQVDRLARWLGIVDKKASKRVWPWRR